MNIRTLHSKTEIDYLRDMGEFIEPYHTEQNGHIFEIGDIAVIVGMEHYTEYNGTAVRITGYREDGEYGRCYYVKGDINDYLNWIYEYRLKKCQ